MPKNQASQNNVLIFSILLVSRKSPLAAAPQQTQHPARRRCERTRLPHSSARELQDSNDVGNDYGHVQHRNERRLGDGSNSAASRDEHLGRWRKQRRGERDYDRYATIVISLDYEARCAADNGAIVRGTSPARCRPLSHLEWNISS